VTFSPDAIRQAARSVALAGFDLDSLFEIVASTVPLRPPGLPL
jgi:hypothetical protein